MHNHVYIAQACTKKNVVRYRHTCYVDCCVSMSSFSYLISDNMRTSSGVALLYHAYCIYVIVKLPSLMIVNDPMLASLQFMVAYNGYAIGPIEMCYLHYFLHHNNVVQTCTIYKQSGSVSQRPISVTSEQL